MSNLYWLSEAQMERLKPFLPKSIRRSENSPGTVFLRMGKPRVDDRRGLSGIIFINRNGLRWCDAPKEYGLAKTLHNRWKRWSDNGVFARIMMGLAAERAQHKTIMIDVSGHAPSVRACPRKSLKAHRTASSLRVKEGGADARSGAPRAA